MRHDDLARRLAVAIARWHDQWLSIHDDLLAGRYVRHADRILAELERRMSLAMELRRVLRSGAGRYGSGGIPVDLLDVTETRTRRRALTWEQVQELRSHETLSYAQQQAYAAQYGISPSAIYKIWRGTMYCAEEPGHVAGKPLSIIPTRQARQRTRLTDDQVRHIRSVPRSYATFHALADEYGCSFEYVRNIAYGYRRTEVTP